jgi:hypothetical protein
VGRVDRERAGGRRELRLEKDAYVEGAPARRELVRDPARDREAAQQRRTLVQAEDRADSPARVPASQRAIRGGRPDVVVPEREGEPSGHVTPSPAGRRLLKADDIGVDGPQAFRHERETVLERLVVAVELRKDAPVEEVERDEAERASRRRRRI